MKRRDEAAIERILAEFEFSKITIPAAVRAVAGHRSLSRAVRDAASVYAKFDDAAATLTRLLNRGAPQTADDPQPRLMLFREQDEVLRLLGLMRAYMRAHYMPPGDKPPAHRPKDSDRAETLRKLTAAGMGANEARRALQRRRRKYVK